jgi:hypothetical protein
MTVASFQGDACPLRYSESDVFLPNFGSFRGIGSSESTRFPDGLVWGIGQKPFTIETVGVVEFMKIFVSMPEEGKF